MKERLAFLSQNLRHGLPPSHGLQLQQDLQTRLEVDRRSRMYGQHVCAANEADREEGISAEELFDRLRRHG